MTDEMDALGSSPSRRARMNSRSCSSIPSVDDRHPRDVDLLVVSGEQVVVARDVGAVVADVAKEGAQGAVVVEAQRQGADLARSGRSWIDMSMGMPSSGCGGPARTFARVTGSPDW